MSRKGWPGSKELERQNWLARNALELSNKTGLSMITVLSHMDTILRAYDLETAEDALLRLYANMLVPAPEGQLSLMIIKGDFIAPLGWDD